MRSAPAPCAHGARTSRELARARTERLPPRAARHAGCQARRTYRRRENEMKSWIGAVPVLAAPLVSLMVVSDADAASVYRIGAASSGSTSLAYDASDRPHMSFYGPSGE